MNWLRRRRPATLYTALLVGFLLTRVLFFAITTGSEYRLYRDYGESARNASLDELYRTRDIEYPHLAILFGSCAGVVADHLPHWTERLVRWRPNKFEQLYNSETQAERDEGDRYEAALSFVLFAVDAWCLWLVYAIARRIYPNDDCLARVGRLLGYALTTSACGLILYDRQDLILGWIALVAIWALAIGRPRLGYAILALGTAFKLVPILLLPIWVLAAATVATAPNATPRRFLRRVAIEAAIAGLILAVWPLLTYAFGGGERGFFFLTFHSQRGLQLEAPVGWPVMLLDPGTELGHGFGSYNLRGDLADRAAKALGVLMPLAALVATGIAIRGFWRAASRPNPPAPFPKREGGGKPPADLSPPLVGEEVSSLIPHVVAYSLLTWIAFIAFNKVGSPQYLMWVAPLVPLLPLRTRSERSWALLILVTMIVTTVIFPCRYKPDLIGDAVREEPLTWRGPNDFGLFLLAIKSVTLLLATGWLAVSVWRATPPSTPSAKSPT